ncbi:hypothetical protein GF380_04275 [Candidatus Uhrbacteria bacterium]|nr:hypothetical protein [Candidatus Uhrbacteria bacterium]
MVKSKVQISKLTTLSDARGTVFEPLAVEEMLNQKNVHVVTSKPGVIRGNHYHIEGEETIVVIGPVQVRFREDDKHQDIEVSENEVYRFIFPPGVPHAIKNTSEKTNVLIAFNTQPHDRNHPDTIREELL